MTVKILIVDDEPDICELLKEILEDEHYEVITAHNAKEARPHVKNGTIDLVLLDIWMPGEDGISLLKNWKKQYLKSTPVIMMSGHGTVETAVQATQLGAESFLEKPVTMARLLSTVSKVLEKSGKQSNKQSAQVKNFSKNEFVGETSIIEDLRDRATIAAIQQKHILLIGETGSGKKCLSKLIHKVGSGTEFPFVEIPPEALIEEHALNTLIGCNDQGKRTIGLLEKANNGTLFIDDITKLSEVFRKLLVKILDQGYFTPIGSQKEQPLNCRIIFASNEDIRSSEPLKILRQDLLYNISFISLSVPALKDHAKDIPLLIDYFVKLHVSQDNLEYRHFSTDVQDFLINYSWPGNINELKNVTQQLMLFSKKKEIVLEDVKNLLIEKQQEKTQAGVDLSGDISLREARERFEKLYLETILKKVGGSVTKLAKISGMERTHLYRKLKTLEVNLK